MGTFGCVPTLTTCARGSSSCESTERSEPLFDAANVLIPLLFFPPRYENGQVGDAHINTQEAKIHKEILQVIAAKSC